MKYWLGLGLFLLLCLLIGLYPAVYFFSSFEDGLLSTKSPELRQSLWWNIGFYTHIGFGGLALLTGAPQFVKAIRIRRLALHRTLGKIYVTAVGLSGVAGLAIASQATGGGVAVAGFASLALVWLFTTYKAWVYIRKKKILSHQKMMIYSFAACFAAVTLRLWLPLLSMAFGDFIPAYRLVAWLAWVPNMLVAYFIVRSLDRKSSPNPA